MWKEIVELVVPTEIPSVNSCYIFNRYSRQKTITTEGRKFKQELAAHALSSRVKPSEEIVWKADIEFLFRRSNRDIDNPVKLILDSFTGIFWKDDSVKYIKECLIRGSTYKESSKETHFKDNKKDVVFIKIYNMDREEWNKSIR